MSNYSNAVLQFPTNLLAYYRLTDSSGSTSAADSSSYAETATSVVGVTFGVSGLVTGSADTAASFAAATSTKITLPYSGGTHPSGPLDFDYTQALHIGMRVTLPTLSNTSFAQIKLIEKDSGTAGWQLIWSRQNVISGYAIEFFERANSGSNQMRAYTAAVSSPGTHSIDVFYDGSGLNSGIQFYIDGLPATTTGAENTLSGNSILNTAAPVIGNPNSLVTSAMVVQELFVYGVENPAGTFPHLTNSGNSGLDALAFGLSNLAQNNSAPPGNPSAPAVIFEKDWSDVDDLGTLQILVYLHFLGLVRLIGCFANSPNIHGASAFRVVLDWWRLSSTIPVGAYQGALGNSADDVAQGLETEFRSQDATNSGIVTATPSGGSSGSGFNVDDVVQGPTANLAAGSVAPQFKVATVSGGAVTSLRPYGYGQGTGIGSYTTAPSGTVSFTAVTGSGTGLTCTVTTGTNRGNYPDAEWYVADLVAANPGCIIFNGGQSPLDYLLWTNHASVMNADVAQLVLMQGVMPNNAAFGASAEFNSSNVGTEWASIISACTIPIIYFGTENTEQIGGPWAVSGVYDTTNKLTNPIEYGYSISSTATGTFTITSGTYNNATGVVTLTMSLPWFYYPDTPNATLGSLTGTGSFASLDGSWPVISSSGNTINLQATASLGAATITGGDLTGPWLRTLWDFGPLLYLAYGIDPTGSGEETWNYWCGNSGTMTMNSPSSGDNAWTATNGNASFFRRVVGDATVNSWMAGILAQAPPPIEFGAQRSALNFGGQPQ